jgi:hypothetical protein
VKRKTIIYHRISQPYLMVLSLHARKLDGNFPNVYRYDLSKKEEKKS